MHINLDEENYWVQVCIAIHCINVATLEFLLGQDVFVSSSAKEKQKTNSVSEAFSEWLGYCESNTIIQHLLDD